MASKVGKSMDYVRAAIATVSHEVLVKRLSACCVRFAHVRIAGVHLTIAVAHDLTQRFSAGVLRDRMTWMTWMTTIISMPPAVTWRC